MLWACDPTSPEPCWTRIARLQAGKASLRQLAFDPSSATHACTLAAACEDGFVRFFERNDRDPSHTAWEPCNSLRCSGAAGKPTCLSWHDIGDGAAHGTALPSLLLVGTSRGQAAVWWLRKETASWVKATDLPLAGDGEGTGPAHAGRPIAAAGLESVTSAAWGPALGRAHETVATASGSVVTLCTLRGTIDALEVRRSAVLPHDSPVWQVGWNPLGTWLACSTQRGQVCLWRPDFGGEWQLCNVVAGEAAMQE
ncbi:Nucleoporin seh1-A [Auxenochlorella protothecoides]|nr:Nucleoporin seh1-A [Auxenochlorella protothecoides]KFM28407.1 Nucleoporin seh1-A [Auxenochlorella protothecoides]RMZ53366.1 hypothetical protein APUTEX25_004854 [Auxenochlorella protothecoides]|eukprot:RMZ53366.1 hypothetical protein APUTEX25_004854 [Auxenochlorella protothecoides]